MELPPYSSASPCMEPLLACWAGGVSCSLQRPKILSRTATGLKPVRGGGGGEASHSSTVRQFPLTTIFFVIDAFVHPTNNPPPLNTIQDELMMFF
ncbi:hypothetical protein MKZ38_009524 [Zalerion maritima]|uniref:Uncharacterized protein n=1 Tax=Zalerion maritima TaxID=339359 RepID=A0AAD5WSY8_9PEZI|nr:hypothetical protein MKZ38_009524 [Zalerion maritima]